MRTGAIILAIILTYNSLYAQTKRARDLGIVIGVMKPGKQNAITDVVGVKVGHTTLIKGDSIRTGVTAILPHQGNIFQSKVPAAIYVGNGFGKLTGYTQVKELGNLETPIILTNTLNVSTAMDALIDCTLNIKHNEYVKSVNALVGETNDGYLNDIRGRHVTKKDVLNAIDSASGNQPAEGSVGAGTGTVCFGYKGGIGTASRKLDFLYGGFTVGVLVQTNFGGVLQVNGVPVKKELDEQFFKDNKLISPDGSCMIIVATDAPLDSRNLERLAKRAFVGMTKTGGIASNGSGDYVIAFSTDSSLRIAHQTNKKTQTVDLLTNEQMSPLFMAAIEATEEAVINSLLAAETMTGMNGHIVEALPKDKLKEILRKYNRLSK